MVPHSGKFGALVLCIDRMWPAAEPLVDSKRRPPKRNCGDGHRGIPPGPL